MASPMRTLVEALRIAATARWLTVAELRLQTRAALIERRARRQCGRSADVMAAGQDLDPDADQWLEAEVLRVIMRHPEGVQAFDIGNQLGVDWRCVPAVARRLIDRAAVEQIASDFYPVQKAS
jgi:hypothetical protein